MAARFTRAWFAWVPEAELPLATMTPLTTRALTSGALPSVAAAGSCWIAEGVGMGVCGDSKATVQRAEAPQKAKRRPKFPHAFSQYSATEADFFQVVLRTSQLTSLLMTDSHAAECRQAVPMRCLRPWQRRSSRSPTTIPARSSSSRGCRANPGRLGSIGSRRAACAPCGRPSPAAPHRMPRAAPCAGRAAPPRSQC